MNNYGCCSQALIFPEHQVPPLLQYLKWRGIGFRDALIEEYADDHALIRWALTPSLFQHIGSRSSKWDRLNPEPKDVNGHFSTQRIWNYQFESWNADVLREEHDVYDHINKERYPSQ
jgi:hypothetical protein